MIRRRAIRLVLRTHMLRYMIGLTEMSWLVRRVEPYEESIILRNLSDTNLYSTSTFIEIMMKRIADLVYHYTVYYSVFKYGKRND